MEEEAAVRDVLARFRAKFQVDQLLIAKTAAWSWSVRPGQTTVAAGILSLNRYAPNFSDVSASEMADLHGLVTTIERALRSTFAHDRINYLMLMMVDHHVHFHVIPRYQTVRRFADLEWVDTGWPALPALADSQHEEKAEALLLIRDTLRAAGGGTGG